MKLIWDSKKQGTYNVGSNKRKKKMADLKACRAEFIRRQKRYSGGRLTTKAFALCHQTFSECLTK